MRHPKFKGVSNGSVITMEKIRKGFYMTEVKDKQGFISSASLCSPKDCHRFIYGILGKDVKLILKGV